MLSPLGPVAACAIVLKCVAVAVLLPTAAHAAPLAEATIARPVATTSYDLATTRRGWAAVAVYSPDQWNLSLFDGAGPWLASSTYPAGQTDFIAINSFLRPAGPYRAEATRVTGGAPYAQWKQASQQITLPLPANDGVTGPSDPDLAFAVLPSTEVVSVYNMYLSYGEAFWVNAVPDTLFFFLQSNPYARGSAIITRAQAVTVPGTRVVGNCTLYTASWSGWHGVVMIGNRAPATTVPGSGLAVALHRFDPTRPDTCPQRHFPDYTPPGP